MHHQKLITITLATILTLLLVQLGIFAYIHFNIEIYVKLDSQCALNTKPIPIQLVKNLNVSQYANDKDEFMKLALPPETFVESKNTVKSATLYILI